MHSIDTLLTAARTGDMALARTCIDQDISINICDETGTTPLHEAITCNHLLMVEFLVRNGADVNLKDRYGNSPLHLALFLQNQTLINYLLDNGGDTNTPDGDGNTPLHRAVFMRSNTSIELFLDKEADINIKNYDGDTPLHLAASRSLSITTILLNRGANIKHQNKKGYSPLHEAVTSRLRSVVQLLLQRGAYSYRCDNADHMLCRYWEQPVVNTPEDLRFYTTLLLSGVSPQDNVLPESLSTIQRHIESTIENWFSPLALFAERCHELTPIFLRALPHLLSWLNQVNNNVNTASLFGAAQKAKDNIDFFRNLNAAMPAELIALIQEDFIYQSLAKALVNALMEIYSLPHFFAKYVVQDCMNYTKQYTSHYQQLFTHDWQTPLLDSNTHPVAEATSTLQNFHL